MFRFVYSNSASFMTNLKHYKNQKAPKCPSTFSTTGIHLAEGDQPVAVFVVLGNAGEDLQEPLRGRRRYVEVSQQGRVQAAAGKSRHWFPGPNVSCNRGYLSADVLAVLVLALGLRIICCDLIGLHFVFSLKIALFHRDFIRNLLNFYRLPETP